MWSVFCLFFLVDFFCGVLYLYWCVVVVVVDVYDVVVVGSVED